MKCEEHRIPNCNLHLLFLDAQITCENIDAQQWVTTLQNGVQELREPPLQDRNGACARAYERETQPTRDNPRAALTRTATGSDRTEFQAATCVPVGSTLPPGHSDVQ